MRYLFSIVMCGFILGVTPSCMSYFNELGITEDDIKEFVKLLKSGKNASFKEISKISSLGNLTALLKELEKGDASNTGDIKKKIEEELKRLSDISPVIKKERESLQEVSEEFAHLRRVIYAEQSGKIKGFLSQISQVIAYAQKIGEIAAKPETKKAFAWMTAKSEEISVSRRTDVLEMGEIEGLVKEILLKAEIILVDGRSMPTDYGSADGRNAAASLVESLEKAIKELQEMIKDPQKAEELYRKEEESMEKNRKEMEAKGLYKK